MVALALALAACGGTSHPAPPPPPPTPPPAPSGDLLADERALWERAKPVLVKYCADCHTRDGKRAAKKKLDHFSLDSYPPGGHHTKTIGPAVREVLGIGGGKATMPFDKPGSVTGDDLAAVKAWADAWEAADNAGLH